MPFNFDIIIITTILCGFFYFRTVCNPLFALFVIVTSSHAGRILMIPVDHHSHVNLFAQTGRALQTSGHEVYILANLRHKDAVEGAGLASVLLDSPCLPFIQGHNYDMFEEALMQNDAVQQFNMARSLSAATENQTEQVLTFGIMQKLEELHLDLAFLDAPAFAHVSYVIPHKLGIKYISLSTSHLPWNVGIPALPSVEPTQVKHFSEDSSFLERLQTTLLYIVLNTIPHFLFYSNELLSKNIPLSEVATVRELYDRSELWFVNLENICLDSSRISSPHYHFIGGVALEPATPLPEDLAEFVEGATNGVIVVSFGSIVKRVPRRILDVMLNALGRQAQRVVMKNDDDLPDNIPSNIVIKTWLPQNDLLGHPNVKLFVTHGGQNGQLEALYHGVPMVVMPFGTDQWHNGNRVAYKRYGEMIDPRDFTEDELYGAIKTVTNNPEYRENIQRCSKIFRALPDPKQTVVTWTNHVLEHGGDHLKPRSINVPMWQFFMWDIWAAFLISGHLVFYVSVRFCCCCLRCYKKEPRKW